MHLHDFRHRLHATSVVASLIAYVLLPATTFAAGNATFEFRPHCEGDDLLDNSFGGPSPDVHGMTKLATGTCTTYEVRDPSSMQTPQLHVGDTLDMDVVINNPSQQPIGRFRAWIAYDPEVLQGLDATVNSAFPVPTPGESGFTDNNGTLKLSGTATTPITKNRFGVARVRFTVLKDSLDGTPLTFTEETDTPDSKTGVFTGQSPNEQNTLSPVLGSLYVRLVGSPASSQSSSAAANGTANIDPNSPHDAASSASFGFSFPTNSTSSVQSKASSAASVQKAFNLLQVLGLRVTTDGSSVFLAWDALPSSELAGYNVYYGTISGQYIQRRTVDKTATSLTIRALPVGTTYYFAIRAYNAAGDETVFSQEVGVSVGNPKTSTSPLAANSLPTKTPTTGGQISGETGASSTLLLLALGCASIGTLIAVRRQLQVSSGS